MYTFHWSDKILDHVEQHGVTREEFELAVNDPDEEFVSSSSGDPMTRRWFGDRWVYTVFRWVVRRSEVEPVTAWQIWD